MSGYLFKNLFVKIQEHYKSDNSRSQQAAALIPQKALDLFKKYQGNHNIYYRFAESPHNIMVFQNMHNPSGVYAYPEKLFGGKINLEGTAYRPGKYLHVLEIKPDAKKLVLNHLNENECVDILAKGFGLPKRKVKKDFRQFIDGFAGQKPGIGSSLFLYVDSVCNSSQKARAFYLKAGFDVVERKEVSLGNYSFASQFDEMAETIFLNKSSYELKEVLRLPDKSENVSSDALLGNKDSKIEDELRGEKTSLGAALNNKLGNSLKKQGIDISSQSSRNTPEIEIDKNFSLYVSPVSYRAYIKEKGNSVLHVSKKVFDARKVGFYEDVSKSIGDFLKGNKSDWFSSDKKNFLMLGSRSVNNDEIMIDLSKIYGDNLFEIDWFKNLDITDQMRILDVEKDEGIVVDKMFGKIPENKIKEMLKNNPGKNFMKNLFLNGLAYLMPTEQRDHALSPKGYGLAVDDQIFKKKIASENHKIKKYLFDEKGSVNDIILEKILKYVKDKQLIKLMNSLEREELEQIVFDNKNNVRDSIEKMVDGWIDKLLPRDRKRILKNKNSKGKYVASLISQGDSKQIEKMLFPDGSLDKEALKGLFEKELSLLSNRSLKHASPPPPQISGLSGKQQEAIKQHWEKLKIK